MKRYLLFLCNEFYPDGGIADLKLAFNTMDELEDFFHGYREYWNYSFFNMYDCLENRSLYEDAYGGDDNQLTQTVNGDYSIVLKAFINFR